MYDELTPSDIKRMEEEIEYRKLVVRKAALEDVKEARAHGDLSENFEYYAAKKYKNQNESRIRYLERMIKSATVIEDNTAEDEVGLFDQVELYFEDDEECQTVSVVTTVRCDPRQGRISKESPMNTVCPTGSPSMVPKAALIPSVSRPSNRPVAVLTKYCIIHPETLV